MNMQTLKIYGASDDLIELSGVQGGDEFNVYSDSHYMGMITVTSLAVKIAIHCIYDGAWTFSISPQFGDYDKFPEWKITRTFGEDSNYSETITIELPNDAIASFSK